MKELMHKLYPKVIHNIFQVYNRRGFEKAFGMGIVGSIVD
jgi:hypothetical protein